MKKIPRNIYALIAKQKPVQIFHHTSEPRCGDKNISRDFIDSYKEENEFVTLYIIVSSKNAKLVRDSMFTKLYIDVEDEYFCVISDLEYAKNIKSDDEYIIVSKVRNSFLKSFKKKIIAQNVEAIPVKRIDDFNQAIIGDLEITR